MLKRCLFALAGGVAGIAASFPIAAGLGAGDWLVQTVAVAGAVVGISLADRRKA